MLVKTKLDIFEWNTTHLFPLTANPLGLPSTPWIAPPQRFYKLNFDGAADISNQIAGVGGIIRDYRGEMVAAYTGAIAATHPLDAELQPLMRGITVCNSKSLKNIFIEGDCLVLVQNLRNLDNIQWYYIRLLVWPMSAPWMRWIFTYHLTCIGDRYSTFSQQPLIKKVG